MSERGGARGASERRGEAWVGRVRRRLVGEAERVDDQEGGGVTAPSYFLLVTFYFLRPTSYLLLSTSYVLLPTSRTGGVMAPSYFLRLVQAE